MKRHISYIKYIIRHKWFVYQACKKVKASLWLGIIHDKSKFHPFEWFPYSEYFYNDDGTKNTSPTDDEKRHFMNAWRMHIKKNPHHWQHWLHVEDSGVEIKTEMPEKYVREMIADWIGAGMAISGRTDPRPWYENEKAKMRLNARTRVLVEKLLEELD